MGELLQFPGDRAGSEAKQEPAETSREPFDGAQEDGAERRSAPSRHPSRGRRPVVDASAEAEPRWAVPGVDDGRAPEPVESTRASRRAENVAMAALTRHDASEGEIKSKLVAKGLDEEDVEAELERLRRVGLIDDAAFATRLVDRLRERKGLGDQAIRSTLRGRLVPQDVIDAVLAEQAEDEDTAAERLQEVADDRARKLGSLDYAVAERRLMAFLVRKGYSGSSVRTAVRAALEGAGIR